MESQQKDLLSIYKRCRAAKLVTEPAVGYTARMRVKEAGPDRSARALARRRDRHELRYRAGYWYCMLCGRHSRGGRRAQAERFRGPCEPLPAMRRCAELGHEFGVSAGPPMPSVLSGFAQTWQVPGAHCRTEAGRAYVALCC